MNKVSFLHTHYLPRRLLEEVDVESSIIALEIYPDLLMKYYNDYDVFYSLEDCISWHRDKYLNKAIKFSIENIELLKNINSLAIAKDMGLAVVQLFHSRNNRYFDSKSGLTDAGYKLLHELIDNDIILDLSHLNDNAICHVLNRYDGKIILSHCVCSDLIETIHPRANAISRYTIDKLIDRGCLFGIPFVNDLVAIISHDTMESDTILINDIISQIIFFAKYVGTRNVALGPDFMDFEYFSKVFKQDIKIPKPLFEAAGYQIIWRNLRDNNFSDEEIILIMRENVNMFINKI